MSSGWMTSCWMGWWLGWGWSKARHRRFQAPWRLISRIHNLVPFRMTASCKRHGIDSFRYLAGVVHRPPTTPSDRLTELLPDVCFLANLTAARKWAA